MSDRTNFGHDTTTDEVLEGIDLTGKKVLITGASGGLGAETTRALASKGASVVITARDIAKAQTAVDAIVASTGNSDITIETVELGSLASIREFGERWNANHDTLDLLINNAGVMACPQDTTSDGFERQFGTNHLGHFLLTGLVAPTLLASGSGRIVNLSSRGHFRGTVDLDDPMFERRTYEKWAAYGQAKTANILHAVELDRRLSGKGIRAVALHPGVIMTDLGRHLTQADIEAFSANSAAPIQFKSVEAGAATSVYAATAPELEGRGGVYLEDCGVAEVDDEREDGGVRSYALDTTAATGLWTLSEELVGQSFDL